MRRKEVAIGVSLDLPSDGRSTMTVRRRVPQGADGPRSVGLDSPYIQGNGWIARRQTERTMSVHTSRDTERTSARALFHRTHLLVAASCLIFPGGLAAQRGANGPFPGGENPDGSLRPSARLQRLFSQEAYTEYAILEPGSEQFRIRFITEESRVGATELVNATRGGSEGTDVEVYDPRTGKPLPFTYDVQGETHAIHAKLTSPVPQGGIGRVLIYKTYKDPRTYQVYREANPQFGIQEGDISWVRSLSGYRLGVILPKGFAFLSSNVAAQMSTLPDGRLELHFANPSGLPNPLTIHARKTTAMPTPTAHTDMFFDDVKTLYDLGAPE